MAKAYQSNFKTRYLIVFMGLFFSSLTFANENSLLFSVIEKPQDLSKETVALGKKLFFDVQLSKNNKISCASCHDVSQGGDAPGKTFSPAGVSGQQVPLNVPTVFNARFNLVQFWDGRAETLEEQVNGPLEGPDEMGSTWQEVIAKLNKSASYVKAFSEIYDDGITAKSIRHAIAEYERSLVTPNSKFDQYLEGKVKFTKAEENGLRLFKSHGCISCHQGVNLGGNLFQKLGVMKPYFDDSGTTHKRDLGRFNVTKRESDKWKFKVPTLRNITLTPPYLHDGSAKTLADVINIMAEHQLGIALNENDVEDIITFFKTLEGERPL